MMGNTVNKPSWDAPWRAGKARLPQDGSCLTQRTVTTQEYAATHFFIGAVCVARALPMEPPPQSPIYICQCVCHRLMSPGCFRQHSYHCDRRAGTVLRRLCSGFQVPVHHGQKGSVKQLPSQPPGRRAKGILTRARMRERP